MAPEASRRPKTLSNHAGQLEIVAEFRSRCEAEAASAALAERGIPRSSIGVEHDIIREGEAREARFILGIVVAIVLWSIAGAIPGAAFGWFLAETIGPEGTEVTIIYVVCMMILGHLVAGMLAGYALLADRTTAEALPDRTIAVLAVTGLSERGGRRLEGILRSHGATDVRIERERAQRI